MPEPSEPVPAWAEEALRSPGQPLDAGLRADFEPRFGHDFGKVRVHTDGRAAASAAAVQARAYTLGQDIVFGPGRYDAASAAGRNLVAHELAHVVQQARSGRAALQLDSELESVPEAKTLRLETAQFTAGVQKNIEKLFLDKEKLELPAGTTVRFGASIDAGLQDGLRNVAIYLTEISDTGEAFLPRNAAIELAITTVERAYRFTRVDRPLKGKNGLPLELWLVEESGVAPRPPKPLWEAFPGPFSQAQGPLPVREARGMRDCRGLGAGLDACRKLVLGIGAPEPSPRILDEGKAEIRKVKFKRGPGWKATEWSAVESALAALPDSALKHASGVKFLREAKKVCTEAELEAKTCSPERSGETNPRDKTIRLFDTAFASSTTRFGQSTWLEVVVAHELGHIADDAPLNAAWAKFVKDLDEAKVLRARSRTGEAWIKVAGKANQYTSTRTGGAPKGSFREAAIQDGLSVKDDSKEIVSGGVTRYGEKSWDELFAESFALYYVDPDLLKAIRPKTYAYFVATYPK
ncbi:MAG: DUF4157 domain-containing protein [Acidobacteriota bacterium]